MHEGIVFRIMAQVKINPNKIEEQDVNVLAHSLQLAMTQFEAQIAPATVYHYHSVAEYCHCYHE